MAKFVCIADKVCLHLSGYDCWLRHVELAPWAGTDYETDSFNTPKGHRIEHMFAQILLFGGVDNARLNNAERDHQPWVKQATKRTRRHMSTMMSEIKWSEMDGVTSRMVAVKQLKAHERECAMGMHQ